MKSQLSGLCDCNLGWGGGIWHTILYQSSTSSYIANLVTTGKIPEKHFVDGWTDIETSFVSSTWSS